MEGPCPWHPEGHVIPGKEDDDADVIVLWNGEVECWDAQPVFLYPAYLSKPRHRDRLIRRREVAR